MDQKDVENTELAPQSKELGAAGKIQMGNRGLVLRSLDDAYRFAQYIVAAKLAPSNMNAAGCLVAIQMGGELGIPPMASVQNIAVINGRPSIWGDAALAVCMEHPSFADIDEYFENENDPNKLVAVCEVYKKGREKPVVRRFSVADRNQAKLGGVHQTYPKRMLQMRARSWALKDAFPGALKGMMFAEEAQELPNEPRTVENEADPLDAVLGAAPSVKPEVVEPEPEKPKRTRKPQAGSPATDGASEERKPEPIREPEPATSPVEDPEARIFAPEDDEPPFDVEEEEEPVEQAYSLSDVYAIAKEKKLKGSQFYGMVSKVSAGRTTKPEDLNEPELNQIYAMIREV